MFDLQTELHLRGSGRDALAGERDGSRIARAILIAANLTILSLLVTVLL